MKKLNFFEFFLRKGKRLFKEGLLLLQSAGLGKQRMKEGKEITNKLERKCPECSMLKKYNAVTQRNAIFNVKQIHGEREKYNV